MCTPSHMSILKIWHVLSLLYCQLNQVPVDVLRSHLILMNNETHVCILHARNQHGVISANKQEPLISPLSERHEMGPLVPHGKISQACNEKLLDGKTSIDRQFLQVISPFLMTKMGSSDWWPSVTPQLVAKATCISNHVSILKNMACPIPIVFLAQSCPSWCA